MRKKRKETLLKKPRLKRMGNQTSFEEASRIRDIVALNKKYKVGPVCQTEVGEATFVVRECDSLDIITKESDGKFVYEIKTLNSSGIRFTNVDDIIKKLKNREDMSDSDDMSDDTYYTKFSEEPLSLYSAERYGILMLN